MRRTCFRSETFESEVVPAFFTEDCFGPTAAELHKNFAYVYRGTPNSLIKERNPRCSIICIDMLRDKIKETPNWCFAHFTPPRNH